MSYCDLHKLSYEDTDCIELFKLVFPDEEYVIVDGIMRAKDKPKVYDDYGFVYKNNNTCITISTNGVSNLISSAAISASCR